MNICIIGMNLTSLILSKSLVNSGCFVNVFNFNKKSTNYSTRTIGISNSNVNFIKRNIINLESKQFHNIKKIRIFSDNKREILKFYNKGENLFSLVEVNKFFNILNKNLKFNKSFKVRNLNEKTFKQTNFEKNFDLVINCEKNNFISKKYFNTNFKKDYNSIAYTALINHKKIKNVEAKQYFTELGPLAFLPLSPKTTSVVFSIYNNKKYEDESLKKFVLNFKDSLNIKKFSKFQKARLNFSLSRKYYYKNILLFGDGLHQIHPLAGQGFNMTLRDLKILLDIIKDRIANGLELEELCLKDFEDQAKPKNFVFSEGINFIQDFFRIKKNFGKDKFDNIIKKIGNNKRINSFFIKVADKGILGI